MHSLTIKPELFITVIQLDFIHPTKIINLPLNKFLEDGQCSKTVFSNILKALTLQSTHLTSFYYQHVGMNPNLCVDTFLNKNVAEIINTNTLEKPVQIYYQPDLSTEIN